MGHTGVDPTEGDEARGRAGRELRIARGVDEPGVVEVHQDLGRKDGDVGLALDEHLLEVPIGVDLAKHGIVVHRPLGIGRVEPLVEGVKGFDERVAEAVLRVLRTRVPEACMGIENERAVFHSTPPCMCPARSGRFADTGDRRARSGVFYRTLWDGCNRLVLPCRPCIGDI